MRLVGERCYRPTTYTCQRPFAFYLLFSFILPLFGDKEAAYLAEKGDFLVLLNRENIDRNPEIHHLGGAELMRFP